MDTALDWESSDRKEGLVSIGDHKLFASVSGPLRKAGQPIVVVLPGSGESSSSYPVVERLVSQFARILLYDRSGIGQSEEGPTKPLAEGASRELHALLNATGIRPPYILVGHSYGAMISREYLHLYPDEITGMVLADPSSELESGFYDAAQPLLDAMLGSLSFTKVTQLRELAKLSQDEWRTRAKDVKRAAPISVYEGKHFADICNTLAAKDQVKTQPLGGKPLSIIQCRSSIDAEKIYNAGLEAGNGTEEERRKLQELLEKWDNTDKEMKLQMLRLSDNSRLRNALDCSHNVNLIRPDIIAEEIQWVLENISESSKFSLSDA